MCGEIDLCPATWDAWQQDTDLDSIGDTCDSCTDSDSDGFGDPDALNNTCSVDNCPAKLNADQADQDLDGLGDVCDNCIGIPNVWQDDYDQDTVGDACDCAPDDSGVFTQPGETLGLGFVSDIVLHWDPDDFGRSQTYNVVRGLLRELPVGSGPSEVCLTSAIRATEFTDPQQPMLGTGFFYLVRGRNVCGNGTYGLDSAGVERTTAICQ